MEPIQTAAKTLVFSAYFYFLITRDENRKENVEKTLEQKIEDLGRYRGKDSLQ